MKTLILSLILISASSAVHAQNLTPAQKEADFRYLASLYSTYYAPIDWKKQLFNFDALAIQPWLDRVAQTKTDLDFYEVCVAYVAGLNDTHDSFTLPSDFVARLGFTTDVYDGVLLIDSINRTALPVKDYPFTIGDQLLSIDGRDVELLLQDFAVYAPRGNPRSDETPDRGEAHHPAAIGDAARHGCHRHVGNGGDPAAERRHRNLHHSLDCDGHAAHRRAGAFAENGPGPADDRARSSLPQAAPDYMTELLNAQWSGVLNPEDLGLNGYGSLTPVFLGALGQRPLHAPPRRERVRFLLFGHVRLRRSHHRLHPDSQLLANFHRGRLDPVREGDRLLQRQYRRADRGRDAESRWKPVLWREHRRAPGYGLLPRNWIPLASLLEPGSSASITHGSMPKPPARPRA